MNLDASQRAAVEFDGRDALVLAPAGAGKTRVLTERVARLVEHGERPRSIVCVTFTTKAAREMRERLAARLGEPTAAEVYLGTFHAWAATIIRRHAERVGLDEDFSIFDESDQFDLTAHIAHMLDVEVRDGERVEKLIARAERKGKGETLRAMYADTLTRYNARDFDGLEETLLELFEQHGGVVEDVRRNAEHVLVDEFQDTSELQAQILGALAPAHIYAVGDFSQSIYGFRGARVENMRDFAARDGVGVLKLSHNYRSGRDIVTAGNAIARACNSPLDGVQAGRDSAGRVEVIDARHVDDVAAAVADNIDSGLTFQEMRPSDVMVLGRTWREVLGVAELLRGRGIPCDVPLDAEDVWGSAPARVFVAALRFAANPRDLHSLRRVCAWPTSVAPASVMSGLEAHCRGGRRRPLGVLREKLGDDPRLVALATVADDVESSGSVSEMARRFFETIGAEALLRDRGLTTQADAIGRVVESIDAWESVADASSAAEFLRWFAFRRVGDGAEVSAEDDGGGAVRCMTIHASKGLEAPEVHLLGCHRGGFPSRWSKTDEAIDEERRLFYVAVTRAADRLYAYSADLRVTKKGVHTIGRSPFVALLTTARRPAIAGGER